MLPVRDGLTIARGLFTASSRRVWRTRHPVIDIALLNSASIKVDDGVPLQARSGRVRP
jgi:hypothetical protein